MGAPFAEIVCPYIRVPISGSLSGGHPREEIVCPYIRCIPTQKLSVPISGIAGG